MTASVTLKFNSAFKAALLNSPGVQQVVTTSARTVQSTASGMFEASNYVLRPARPGKVRCHAYVATGDLHAMRSNARHMTLMKSLGV